MFTYCNNNPVRYADYSGSILVEVTLSTAGTIVAISICGIAIIHFGAQALCVFLDWLVDQWYYAFAQISFIYESEAEQAAEIAEVSASYMSPDPFDDDDDYYDNEDNFASKSKVGKRKGNTPQNNHKQNADFDRVAKEFNLNYKQQEMLHHKISGQGLDYDGIIEVAKAIFMIIAD